MIFVTVGTQLGFDRLVQSIDAWAEINPDTPIFAQIGDGTYIPRHMQWCRSLDNLQFNQQAEACNVIVSHAGMGTILTAMQLSKALILVPRHANLGEHRNDHQLATCKKFEHLEGINVAWTNESLLTYLTGKDSLTPARPNSEPSIQFSAILKTKIDAMLA
jgi:UDP-N-acetylglucosamine transferase subunit ALG13